MKIKKGLYLFSLFVLLFALVSCSKTKKLDKALDALEIGFSEGDSKDSVTSNLTLPTESKGVTITWSSSNTSFITNTGVVIQGTKEINVKLTATASIDKEAKSKEFDLTVKPSNKKIVETAIKRISINDIADGVTGDLTLAPEVVVDDIKMNITWTTSDDSVIDVDGTVFRPSFGSENKTVTLTASITYEGVTKTKEFSDIVVLAKTIKPKVTGTIANALTTAKKGDWVLLQNVTVVGKTSDGFYVADNTEKVMFIYTKDIPSKKLEVGKVYDIEAEYAIHYFAKQMQAGSTEPVSFSPKNDQTPYVLTPEEVSILDVVSKEIPSDKNLLENIYITIEGIVHIEGTGEYNTYIMPVVNSKGNSYDGKLDTKEALMVYSKGNKDAIEALSGKKIKINAFLHSYRTDKKVWTINFLDDASDIKELELTPTEIFASAKGIISNSLKKEYIENTKLELLTEVNGATVTWSSDKENIVNSTTGVLTIPQGDRELVTLTATLSYEGETDTVSVTINVGKLPQSTVKQVIDGTKGLMYQTTGVLTGLNGNNTYGLQDANNGITIYATTTELKTALNAAIGKTVTLLGTKDVYNDLQQLKDVKVIKVEDGTMPESFDITSIIGNNEELIKKQSMLVNISKALITKITPSEGGSGDSKYKVISMTLEVNGKTIDIRWESRVYSDDSILKTLKVNDIVDVVSASMSWYKNPQINYTNKTQIVKSTLTDTEAVAFAKANLEFVEEAAPKEVIDLPATGLAGTAITWSVDKTDLVTIADNKATIAETATGTVTFTATITKNDATDSITFTVVLKDHEDVLLAKYDFSSLTGTGEIADNDKLKEILNASDSVKNYTLKSVTNVEKIYNGNDTGGTYPSTPGLIKVGSSKANGKFTLIYNEAKIKKVVVYIEAWTTTDKMTLNGVEKNITQDKGAFLTFEFTDATDTLNFEFIKRGFIFKIELYA